MIDLLILLLVPALKAVDGGNYKTLYDAEQAIKPLRALV